MLNANNTQVGHIPRAVAGKLAALMDAKLITVEGRMIGQNLDRAMHYKLGMDMSIYARPSHREVLEPELAWATPGQRGFEAMRAAAAAGSQQGSQGTPKGKGKAKARGMGDTGLHGSGDSGVGLPRADWDEQEMRRLLDGLKKVQEDEKQANTVMVSPELLPRVSEKLCLADEDAGRPDERYRCQQAAHAPITARRRQWGPAC